MTEQPQPFVPPIEVRELLLGAEPVPTIAPAIGEPGDPDHRPGCNTFVTPALPAHFPGFTPEGEELTHVMQVGQTVFISREGYEQVLTQGGALG